MTESSGLSLSQSEFCLETTLRFGVDDLRQSFEHYDRLVCARHHGFCNGDESILLAEYTQPRRLRFTAIQLRRRSGRRLKAARLELSERNIELRAMTHAPFDHGQNVDARKISQQVFEGNQTVREFPGHLGLRKFLKRDCLLQRKFSDRRPRDFRQVRAAPELLPHLMRQRTNVSAGRALDDKACDATLNLLEYDLVDPVDELRS